MRSAKVGDIASVVSASQTRGGSNIRAVSVVAGIGCARIAIVAILRNMRAKSSRATVVCASVSIIAANGNVRAVSIAGIARIVSAKVIVIANNRIVGASTDGVASINCASMSIITANGSVGANTSRARIVSAGIRIVTVHSGGIDAISSGRIASLREAKVRSSAILVETSGRVIAFGAISDRSVDTSSGSVATVSSASISVVTVLLNVSAS